jgi:hypothetical protein
MKKPMKGKPMPFGGKETRKEEKMEGKKMPPAGKKMPFMKKGGKVRGC